MSRGTMEARFWDKVDRSDGDDACWLWIGGTSGTTPHRLGYGVIGTGEGTKNMKAHRYSWELHNGPIPRTDEYHGLCVCHRCDNPLCVNPRHLFLGTHLDNMRDMVAKGRLKNPRTDRLKEQTTCPEGHPYSSENTYEWHGARRCKVCHRNYVREWYRSKARARIAAARLAGAA